ncbi:hypothetical protein [Corynebacterium sanguinis]|nr:hypothetical protein [Corynebacterium sanguinis]
MQLPSPIQTFDACAAYTDGRDQGLDSKDLPEMVDIFPVDSD